MSVTRIFAKLNQESGFNTGISLLSLENQVYLLILVLQIIIHFLIITIHFLFTKSELQMPFCMTDKSSESRKTMKTEESTCFSSVCTTQAHPLF